MMSFWRFTKAGKCATRLGGASHIWVFDDRYPLARIIA